MTNLQRSISKEQNALSERIAKCIETICAPAKAITNLNFGILPNKDIYTIFDADK